MKLHNIGIDKTFGGKTSKLHAIKENREMGLHRARKSLHNKRNNKIKKHSTDWKGTGSNQRTQYKVANKHMKRCSGSLAITEIKIKTILQIHLP